ncbi:threonine dehydratase [Acuticoccus sp. MNP-M23]|uniref:threonine dehydratase n=1 Tax=Acuticoccus sp. MNP-M23 TaxID=3072793 RepID=UPI002815D6B3|nr:threonine dehydratase [Acuticoccus sp. MNP-M23]WMS42196.1 threonine dehydratase [Acuticoccus sp. MNP-M23]
MDLETIERAAELVYRQMPPTPQYEWPQISAAAGARVHMKHENHTPTGAFKLRGAITFMDWLRRTHPDVKGIVTATRGNHGQGQALAATSAGLRAVIVVPHGNSAEKNAAMKSFGADLVEFGADFEAAKQEAFRLAEAENLYFVPPFHDSLVAGVATYGLELFRAVGELDAVYVPIGCGSGICGVIHARNALGYKTEVVGVVAAGADYAKRSFDAGRPMESETAATFADGVAVRAPVPAAFEIYGKQAARVIALSEREIADAIRLIFRATHNVAEGAGAAPMAGLMQERERMAGKNVGVILCGQNIDSALLASILAGETPGVA